LDEKKFKRYAQNTIYAKYGQNFVYQLYCFVAKMKIANFHFLLQMVVMLLLCLTAESAPASYCVTDEDCLPPLSECVLSSSSALFESISVCTAP